MIHIVFQEADVDALAKSFELDKSMHGSIVQIKDEFAVGPLTDVFSREGIESRKQWWRDILVGSDYEGLVDGGHVDDEKTVFDLKKIMQNDLSETAWIWVGQNKHDVSGYYWLITQLKDLQGRILILFLNNLPFINEKGQLFYPQNLSEIPPREFVKAKKLARPVTSGEFEIDSDEWTKLCNEIKGVRLLEGAKKLMQYEYDYYDEELRKFITGDWQKAGRLIHHFLHKASNKTGDAYLLWRLKLMVANNEIDVLGEPKGMKDFEVKLKSQSTNTVPENRSR